MKQGVLDFPLCADLLGQQGADNHLLIVPTITPLLLLLLISGFNPTMNITLRFRTSGSGDSHVGQFQHGKYFVVRK